MCNAADVPLLLFFPPSRWLQPYLSITRADRFKKRATLLWYLILNTQTYCDLSRSKCRHGGHTCGSARITIVSTANRRYDCSTNDQKRFGKKKIFARVNRRPRRGRSGRNGDKNHIELFSKRLSVTAGVSPITPDTLHSGKCINFFFEWLLFTATPRASIKHKRIYNTVSF